MNKIRVSAVKAVELLLLESNNLLQIDHENQLLHKQF